MIVYDLKCRLGHKFEGWFRDRGVFEEQRSKKLITCPNCGSADTELVLSSVTIMGRNTKEAKSIDSKELSPQKAMQMLYEYVSKNFDDVGDRFTETAIKIKQGKEDPRNIRGTTSDAEEELLKEEGVQFAKVPFPKWDA
ncbi:MAG: DUF1178 family protein [Smithellaceae bacterium]|nr:DUF1178 family protein [Smithellaceae bacterium]